VERVDGEIEMRAVLLNAILHLGCGFIGEGERQDLARRDPFIEEVDDLFGDYSCFTGTGAGKDELDAGGGDGLGLGAVEGHA